MMNKELLLYIQAQQKAGMPDAVIKEMLMTRGGWRAADIDEALRSLKPLPVTPTPPPAPAPSPAPVAPMSAPVQAPVQPPAPKVNPNPTRYPGTTLVSQSPEISAASTVPAQTPTPPPTPVPAPISTQAPVAAPTPAPTPEPTRAPTPEPVQAIANPNLQPTTPSAVYQPTRADNTPFFTGMQKPAEAPAPRKSKALLKTLIALVVLLMLGAGAAYGYFFYINPSPSVAFQTVVPALLSAKTGHLKTVATLDFDKSALAAAVPSVQTPAVEGIPISENTNSTATVTLETSFDKTVFDNPKSETVATATSSAFPMTLKLETKIVDRIMYAKVPDLGFLNDIIGGNTSAFLPGDWVAFQPSEISSMLSLPIELPLLQGVDAAKQKQVEDIFIKGGAVTPTIELSKATLDGTTVHRYQFSFDKEALKKSAQDSYAFLYGSPMPDSQVQALTQFLDGFTISDGELWVGVWDRKPHRIIFTVKPSGDLGAKLHAIKFDITLSSFGTPVTITAPASPKSFTSLFEQTKKQTQDAGIKAALGSIMANAQIYYSVKKSYAGLCAAPTGLKGLLDTFAPKLLPGVAYCKDAAKQFAVAMPLSSETGVACVDATGKVATIAATPTGTECK
jgi:hypothetical protein